MFSEHHREIHLLDYWRVLLKRRWVIYTSLAVMVTTVTLGTLLMEPVYTATTRLQIERSAPNVLPFQQVIASGPDQLNDFYQTQYGLIQSRRVARDVIVALELGSHPEFRMQAPPERDAAMSPGQEIEARRVDVFLARLKVTPVRGSRLVDVSFSSHDRVLAARAANRVAETYIAFNTEAQYNTTERASASLGHQIASQQEEIDIREKRLQTYASENGIIPLNEKQSITLKNLNDLSNAYTRAQAVRIEKEARHAALRQSSPEGVPEVLGSPVVQQLTSKAAELARRHAEMSDKFQPEWPEMTRLRSERAELDRRLEEERRSIYDQVVHAAESSWRAALNEEAYLKKALEDLKLQAQELSLKEIEYNNLKLAVENRRATLEALVKRQSEASTSAGMNDVASSNVRVVDVAEVPIRPSSPRVRLNILLSLVAGLCLGVALAFFFEYLDKSVKTSEEMQAATGVPAIGFIPALRGEGARLHLVKSNGHEREAMICRVDLVSQLDPKAKASEAFREMRTALLVSKPGGPPRTILITSSEPGDGKTAVALNLAITLAQLGRRVLLVDADLRRPRLHKVLGLPNEDGLSGALSATGPLNPRTCRTTIGGLDLLPSGPLPPNPADLLDSDRFDQLDGALRAAGYDHVIFDSPPVLAVADPAIMAGRMEAVVMVARAGITGRDALSHAARRLRQVNAHIVGGVLNQIDMRQQSYYGGYYYRKYYGEEKETPRAAAGAGGGGTEA